MLALTDVVHAVDAEPVHRAGHGLALRVENLGFGKHVDDHAGHDIHGTGRPARPGGPGLRPRAIGNGAGVEIVHLGHACVVLDTGAARLLLDPGAFSSGYETLEGLDAIMITHQHFDHLDLEKLPALLGTNPDAELIVDPGTADVLRGRGIEHTVRAPGESFDVGGAHVDVVGGDHAVIHPDLPGLANNGYLVDGSVLHPGDAFVPPERPVDVLLLPTGAPWLKVSEAVDYLREVAPSLAVPIHEAVLANPDLHYRLFSDLAPENTEVRIAAHGRSLHPG